MLNEQTEPTTKATASAQNSMLGRAVQAVKRSMMLMLIVFGAILIAFSGIVLPLVGLKTTAGLLGVAGFNIIVIGLIGHVSYNVLEKRLR